LHGRSVAEITLRMTLTALHQDESARVSLLHSTQLLDADHADVFQPLTRLLAMALQVPAVAINLIDNQRVWALASIGLNVRQLALRHTPCTHVVQTRQAMQLPDLRADSRFAHLTNGSASLGFLAYAGVPLVVEGQVLGTVCAFDTMTHAWTNDAQAQLEDVASTAAELILGKLMALRARHSEERVNTACHAGGNWLWETDATGRLTWVSAGLLQHTGIDPSTELGCTPTQIIRPRNDETSASWDRYLEARSRQEPFHDLIAERDTPCGRITVSVSGTPVFNTTGQLTGYRGTSRDITDQISAELAARRTDILLGKAIETFHMSVVITDNANMIVLANRHWRESIGDAYDPTQKHWPSILLRLAQDGSYPDAKGREDEFVAWRLNLRHQNCAQEIRVRDRWLLVRDEPLGDGHTVHFAMDVTQTRENAELLKLQRQALHDSEARLSAVLRALPDLWFVIGADNCYVDGHMNHPLMNSNIEDILGKPMGANLPSDIGLRQRDAVTRARTTGTPQALGYDLRTKDNVLRHFEARFTPMPAGQVLFLTADITERKMAADKLRVSEELYRSVAATISDGLIIIDLEGQVVALNPAARRILGLPTDVATQANGDIGTFDLLEDDLVTPLPQQRWPIMETMRTGTRVTDRVVPARRADQEIVWLQMSAHLIRVDKSAPPFAAMATFRDITRERQTIQDLALSEERWKFALEGAGDGVWDWDMASGCMYYSTRWKQMLGYEDNEIQDSPEEYFLRVHPADRDAVSHSTMRFMTKSVSVQQVEFRLRHRQGHYLSILSRGKVVSRARDGAPLRVVGTHSDITLFKEAEQAQHQRALAEAASAAKSEFLSRMSHEIRTPLNAITGFAQLMRLQLGQANGDNPLRNYISQILHAGQHLSSLVDDVLDLQQVEAGLVKLRLENITLEDELVQCLSMLLPMAEQREISMSSEIAPGASVLADRQRLRQVLMNVGANAIKYNRHGGKVKVRAQQFTNDTMELSLEDTGVGMTSEQLSRLYQPFERLGRETSNVEGSGLGLIITRSLVTSMGGQMVIDSQPGAGTQVSIMLPCGQTDFAQPHAQLHAQPHDYGVLGDGHNDKLPPCMFDRSQQPQADLAPLRVLYVEDNRINSMLFTEALRPYAELALEVAEDGDMALTLAQTMAPHVLVLDAHLPGMSGFEVLQAMRKLPALANVPAYMCSADAMPEDIERAKAAGFTGYWTKPIDIVAVTTTLCQLAQTVPRVPHNAAP
jgi:PAS domain S-box-containing protein